MTMEAFEAGDYVVYMNGDSVELGLIKRVCVDGAFVWYHGGETAAKTPFECMRPLRNAYTIKHTTLGGAAAIEGCPDGVSTALELLNENRLLPTSVGCSLVDAYNEEHLMADKMAAYILSGVPLDCEVCSNPMRNMEWNAPHKGCDGNCQRGKALESIEETRQYFMGRQWKPGGVVAKNAQV